MNAVSMEAARTGAMRMAGRPRSVAMLFVLLVHLLLAYALVSGLALRVIQQATSDLKTFDVAAPAPPAPEPPAPAAEAPAEPTPLEASAPAVPTRANPAAASIGDSQAAPAAGAVAASGASLIRGAFNNESDYPSAARRREEQGTVQVRFTVGADGRVSGCTVLRSSGSSSLDSTTCRIFERRFRYAPARDGSGNAVAQPVTQSVTWRLT